VEGTAVKLPSGLEILEDHEGSGPPAGPGDTIIYNARIFLNRGDEVPMNETQARQGVPAEQIRRENDQTLVDHRSTLGKRQVIAGIEKTLLGMRVGGYRKVRVSPHLAYGSRGVPDLVPPNAVLQISLWLRGIVTTDSTPNRQEGTVD